ncbi:hypothetical protein AB0J43_02810 [Nonomuraea fuscirosea]
MPGLAGSAAHSATSTALGFPVPRVATATPDRSASSTTRPPTPGMLAAPTSEPVSDADAWIAPVAWLLIILTGIGATCYVVYRRRERDHWSRVFVGGTDNDTETK